MKKLLLIIAFIITFLGISTFVSIYYLTQTGNNLDEVEVYIPENSTISTSINKLNELDYLKPKLFFKVFIKAYSKYSNSYIYAGLYKIKPNQTNLEVIKMLFNGGYDLTVKVTIPEGSLYSEFEKAIFKEVEVDTMAFRSLIKSDSIKAILGVPSGRNIEGYLLPETYFLYKYSSPQYLVNKLVTEQTKFWQSLNFDGTTDKTIELNGMNFDKNELITLASIVQAETPLISEAPIVAGLYLNRLKIGMLLQSDPTVQFASGNKSRVLYKDLEVNSRYNTYKYTGLPPGPINSPGKKVIEAVINYEKHNYYYMVAYGDGSGKHRFATNLNEHNRNVSLYRRTRKAS